MTFLSFVFKRSTHEKTAFFICVFPELSKINNYFLSTGFDLQSTNRINQPNTTVSFYWSLETSPSKKCSSDSPNSDSTPTANTNPLEVISSNPSDLSEIIVLVS